MTVTVTEDATSPDQSFVGFAGGNINCSKAGQQSMPLDCRITCPLQITFEQFVTTKFLEIGFGCPSQIQFCFISLNFLPLICQLNLFSS